MSGASTRTRFGGRLVSALIALRPGLPGLGTLPSPAARTPRRRIRGTSKSYARQRNCTAGARPACGRRRADDRAGNVAVAEPSTSRLCSGQAAECGHVSIIARGGRGFNHSGAQHAMIGASWPPHRAACRRHRPSGTSAVLGRSRPALPETRCRLPIGARELRLGPPVA